MDGRGCEAILALRVLCRGARLDLAFGPLERLPRDMNRDGQHVRQPEARHETQRSVCGTQAFFAPADERLPKVMAPVVRLQRCCPSYRGEAIVRLAGSVESEAECRPGFAPLWRKPTRTTGVFERPQQRRSVGIDVGS